MTFAAFAFM